MYINYQSYTLFLNKGYFYSQLHFILVLLTFNIMCKTYSSCKVERAIHIFKRISKIHALKENRMV